MLTSHGLQLQIFLTCRVTSKQIMNYEENRSVQMLTKILLQFKISSYPLIACIVLILQYFWHRRCIFV